MAINKWQYSNIENIAINTVNEVDHVVLSRFHISTNSMI